jgi:hypothetical protein
MIFYETFFYRCVVDVFVRKDTVDLDISVEHCSPFNRITLGQYKHDNNIVMIHLSDVSYLWFTFIGTGNT